MPHAAPLCDQEVPARMPGVSAPPRSRALAPFVSALHIDGGEVPPSLERILPRGCAELMVNLHEDESRTHHGPGHREVRRTIGAVLAGPHTAPRIVDTRLQRRVLMVAFRPGGAAPFFREPLWAAENLVVGLDDLWGRDGATLREHLLGARTPEAMFERMESILLRRLRHGAAPDALVPAAMAALARGDRVGAVGERLGVSPSTLLRRFRAGTGLAPKAYARVQRLQRLVRAIAPHGPRDWAGLAAEHGYTDQAHLIHDFRELAGVTPAAYRPRTPCEHNHVTVRTLDR